MIENEENSETDYENSYFSCDDDNIDDYYCDKKYKYIIFEIEDYKLKDYDITNKINDYDDFINKYDFNNPEILNIIGLYYYMSVRDFKLTKKYFRSAIKLNCINTMKNFAKYYINLCKGPNYIYIDNTNKNDINKAKKFINKYCKMAISKGDTESYKLLANYYENINESEMIKYYMLYNTSESYFSLSLYYMNKNNQELMEIYLLTAIDTIDNNIKINLHNFIKKYTNKLKLYLILKNLENPQQIIINEIKELEKIKEIQKYKNKIRIFTELENIKECIVCKEDKLNIILDCAHKICIDCYPIIDKCYYNC
jgi:hypothetical protein